MKGRLIIKNVGPIKDVTIELNKINVIIGKQGCGKSTIAKLISYFAWVEKGLCTKLQLNYFLEGTIFYDRLVSFHKMDGYFDQDSFISYDSEFVHIEYNYGTAPIITKHDNKMYKRVKVSYIPAERNIVAAIPNWFEVKLSDNNILSFMRDWETARRLHTEDNSINIPNSSIEYYFDENSGDMIKLDGKKKIQFTNSASGYQSSIPMIAVTDYVTKGIYSDDYQESVQMLSLRNNLITSYLKSTFEDETIDEIIGKALNSINNPEYAERNIYFKEFSTINRIAGMLTKTNLSKVIIEEPEQNLFPETQRDILYSLIGSALDDRVNMTITTHSPYILYALNNCIMGGLVSSEIPSEIGDKLPSKSTWINPKDVSIWQITGDGGVESVQNEKTGTLKSQYLNTSMNEVMNEYFVMLKYLK